MSILEFTKINPPAAVMQWLYKRLIKDFDFESVKWLKEQTGIEPSNEAVQRGYLECLDFEEMRRGGRLIKIIR